ncbi:hypothetical protein V5F44_21105 [Xanthobacter sp. V2C-8]|uniref:hypothetical protein n=1 Tax=Xanthobacter albus TaxID=3119929 RepID=UPI0037280307
MALEWGLATLTDDLLLVFGEEIESPPVLHDAEDVANVGRHPPRGAVNSGLAGASDHHHAHVVAVEVEEALTPLGCAAGRRRLSLKLSLRVTEFVTAT